MIYIGHIGLVLGVFLFVMIMACLIGMAMLFMGDEDVSIPPVGALIVLISLIFGYIAICGICTYSEIGKEERYQTFEEWSK